MIPSFNDKILQCSGGKWTRRRDVWYAGDTMLLLPHWYQPYGDSCGLLNWCYIMLLMCKIVDPFDFMKNSICKFCYGKIILNICSNFYFSFYCRSSDYFALALRGVRHCSNSKIRLSSINWTKKLVCSIVWISWLHWSWECLLKFHSQSCQPVLMIFIACTDYACINCFAVTWIFTTCIINIFFLFMSLFCYEQNPYPSASTHFIIILISLPNLSETHLTPYKCGDGFSWV